MLRERPNEVIRALNGGRPGGTLAYMTENTDGLSPLHRRVAAEAAGTFVLVLGVIGTAVFGAGFDEGKGGLNVGFLGVALALGLSVFVGASVFGPVSGGHFNPAVTIGLAVARRFAWREVPAYVVAQVVGGALASSLLVAIAGSLSDVGAASTGWGGLSPGGHGLPAAFLIETVTTCLLVAVVLGVTTFPTSNPPLVIGLTLTLVALVAIPVSNGSFNPARSIATAVYGGPEALGQLWMSVVAPVLGAVIAGAVYVVLGARVRKTATVAAPAPLGHRAAPTD